MGSCAEANRSSDSPRGKFSLAVGRLCPDFYAEVGVQQTRLKQLRVTERSSLSKKRKGLAIADRLQARSHRFLSDLRSVPKPEDARDRQDADELLVSTARFLRIQEDFTKPLRALIAGTPNTITANDLKRPREELGAELVRQQR